MAGGNENIRGAPIPLLEKAGRRLGRFLCRDEEGGPTTIEFVLWLPIFVFVLCLVVDVCFLFLRQSIMYDIASDTARRYAVHQFAGDEPTEEGTANEADSVEEAARNYAYAAATFGLATPKSVSVNEAGGEVTVVVTHALQDIDVTGVLNFVSNQDIEANVTQLIE